MNMDTIPETHWTDWRSLNPTVIGMIRDAQERFAKLGGKMDGTKIFACDALMFIQAKENIRLLGTDEEKYWCILDRIFARRIREVLILERQYPKDAVTETNGEGGQGGMIPRRPIRIDSGRVVRHCSLTESSDD